MNNWIDFTQIPFDSILFLSVRGPSVEVRPKNPEVWFTGKFQNSRQMDSYSMTHAVLLYENAS